MASRAPLAQDANGKDRVAATIRVPEPFPRRTDRCVKEGDMPTSRSNRPLEAAAEKPALRQDRRSDRDGS